MQYSFEHFIKSDFPVHPFIKVGAEYFSFTGKTDMKDENGQYYVIDENGLFRDPVTYLPDNRDYEYETDLREGVDWGLGDYTRSSFAIPVDLGLELKITERSYLNIGYSIHFAFSEDIVKQVLGNFPVVYKSYRKATFSVFQTLHHFFKETFCYIFFKIELSIPCKFYCISVDPVIVKYCKNIFQAKPYDIIQDYNVFLVIV